MWFAIIKSNVSLSVTIDPEPSIDLKEKLQNAQDDLILEYIVYHDNQKMLTRVRRSLIAMVAPPLWLLNNVARGCTGRDTGCYCAFVAHPILGGYIMLCLYLWARST